MSARVEAQAAMDAAIGQAVTRFEKARQTLVLDQFQLGALAMGLKLLADPRCKTAWVDGRSLGFNPHFVLSLTPKRLIALVAHEVLHVALGHPWRRGNRDMRRWNIACDKAINTLLRGFGFELPDGAYYAEGDEQGQSAEWIYDHMPFDDPQDKPKPEPGKGESGEEEGEEDGENEEGGGESEPEGDEDGEGDDEGDGESGEEDGEGEGEGQGDGDEEGDELGECRDAPLDSDAEGDGPPSEDEWKERVAQTSALAKGQGLETGEALTRAFEQTLQPRVDVYSLVLRFMQESNAASYDWQRPNPRYAGSGYFFPKRHSKEMGEVAIAIDTSGSIDQVALGKAAAIVQEVLDEVEPAGVTLYFADEKVCHVQRLERGDTLVWEPKGGWGTDFRPVLEAIDADENQPVCTIFITDLLGIFPQVEPQVPVLWLATLEREAPFGETVYVGW
jgi:predicted metal-dependent peptidase